MCNTITVYQSLDQKEKVINYSSQPELVYSRLTTLSLIVRQLQKEGTGLIFCRQGSLPKLKNNFPSKDKIIFMNIEEFSSIRLPKKRLVVVTMNERQPIRISELNAIVKSLQESGTVLKWITILQQPAFNQLFKWELKYN